MRQVVDFGKMQNPLLLDGWGKVENASNLAESKIMQLRP